MGWVYLLKADTDCGCGKTLIKIGLTNKTNYTDRFSDIQREWWDKRSISVSLLAVEKTSDAAAVEANLHKQFKKYRQYNKHLTERFGHKISGDSEWFIVPSSLINDRNGIKAQADRLSDRPDHSHEIPWAVLAIGALAIGFFFAPKFTPTQKTIVVSQRANIRSAPNGRILCVAEPNEELRLLSDKGQWVGVEACDRSGVIHRSLLKN